MYKERKKFQYLSDHGWKPKQYINRNQSVIIWRLQVSDGYHTLESNLSTIEIGMLEYRSLVRHCEYIGQRMRRELARVEKGVAVAESK